MRPEMWGHSGAVLLPFTLLLVGLCIQVTVSVPHSDHHSNISVNGNSSSSFGHEHFNEDVYYASWGRSTDCGFTCRDEELNERCISSTKVCDNVVDCPNASDEMECSCRDRIGQKKICDGIQDCPDGDDEAGCDGCSANEFSCNAAFERDGSIKCIPMIQVCNGHSDCSLSEDENEEMCFRLVQLGSEERGIQPKGFLQKRIGKDWHFVCKGARPDHVLRRYTDKVCLAIVGETVEKPKYSPKLISTRMSKVIADSKFVLLGDSDNKFTKIDGICPSKSLIMVECPDPECGWPAKGPSSRMSHRFKRHGEALGDLDNLSELTAKIVGGKDSNEGSWPFLVAIYRNGTFHCGGSIIDNTWIMTAAHCFSKKEKYIYEIQAGMLRRYSWSQTEQCRQVADIYLHERYDSKIFLNDIALMKLDHPLLLSKWVRPACLVRSDQRQLFPEIGQACSVAGWGDMAESIRGPDQLQQVSLPVIPKCLETFTKDTMQICAGIKEGGKDACQGDSGGPFTCMDDDGRQKVAGIVSFGRGCARPNQPGVYSRVSYFASWIDSVISGENVKVRTQSKPMQCGGERCIRSGGECIIDKQICDRKVDCLDGSDEENCAYPAGENFDGDGLIDERAYSEVVDALHDNEEHVHKYGTAKLCGPTEYQCAKTKSCVPISYKCDGIPGCSDSTDEMHCTCGQIIANKFPEKRCNGFQDCHDSSDELPSECDSEGILDQFKCVMSSGNVKNENVCNGVKDCPKGEDEVDCFRLVRSSKSFKQVPDDFLGDKISRVSSSGYLIMRERTKVWSPVCEEDEPNEQWAEVVCSALGFNLPDNSARIRVQSDLESRPRRDTGVEQTERNCTFVRVICGDMKCGVAKLYSKARGHPPASEFGAHPWFVVVAVDGNPKCGGTLIHKQWILVSSSCLKDSVRSLTSQYVTGIASFSNQTTMISNPAEQIKRVNSIDNTPGSEDGLSYLHLESPFKTDHFANPICKNFSDKIEPQDLDRSDCRRVSFNGTRIIDTMVQVDIANSKQGEYFALKMDEKSCKESTNQSFVYCTNDGSTWHFLGLIDSINEKDCDKKKSLTLINPFYGKKDTKAFDLLSSPPSQSVQAPQCSGVRCAIGTCLEKSDICNSVSQCPGGEDEVRCTRNYLRATYGDDNEEDIIRYNGTENTVSISCPSAHFQCQSSGNCVPISTFCDGVYDCGTDDWTDEPNENECTCQHYLTRAAPDNLCDGIAQCPNREDEIGHCSCDENSFHCMSDDILNRTTSSCINALFVCDGIEDCVNAKDEQHCLDLFPSLAGPDKFTSLAEYTEGYVIIRHHGSWHPFCTNNWSIDFGNYICSTLTSKGELKLETLESFELTRFDMEELLVVADEDLGYGSGEENQYKTIKISSRGFLDEETEHDESVVAPENSACELGYVKCTL